MPVTSSTYQVGHEQKDGRRYVREVHTLSAGSPVEIEYLAPTGWTATEYEGAMTARVAQIDVALADAEYAEQIEREAFSLAHQTGAELAARFRAEYLDATRGRACQMAWWLLERIAAGDFTDTQARNAFGLTIAQWDNLKSTRLTPQHDAWAAVRAATGA